jgi:hypothetical protein
VGADQVRRLPLVLRAAVRAPAGGLLTDGELLADAIARLHPDPFRTVTEAELRARAERADGIVPLMRLAALLGPRNGHTGIFPFDDHPVPTHGFPLVPYEFADGVFVVAGEGAGRELRAVAGVPLDELLARIEPLVPRDNEWTVVDRRPDFVVSAQVLSGLGVAAPGRAVAFELAGSGTSLVEPVPAGERPLRPAEEPRWVRALDGGRVVHVAYNVTRGDLTAFAEEVGVLAARAEGVVLDLRRNRGGDNRTYGPLLEVLERLAERGRRLAVLIGRATFSAAMQLVVDLERRTPAVFVGEPTGGSPNQFGDAQDVALPGAGLRARVATIAWATAGADDARLSREPDVRVDLVSDDHFAGRDPVLEAALAELC